MMGRMTMGNMTGNMSGSMMNGSMMNGNMMNGNMTGMMTGNMTGATMRNPFGFSNGFGNTPFGNTPFGFSGNMFPSSGLSGLGGYGGGGYGGGGYGGGGYGMGGYGSDNLYNNPYAPNDASSTAHRKSQKREPVPTLTPEQERERLHQQDLSWSRSELSENETTSATALNVLLTDLQGLQTRNPRGADVKLDPAVLASINVVVGNTNGNIGVLKHEGRIQWPATLRGPEFESERQRIDSSIPRIIDDAIRAENVDLHVVTGALAAMHHRLAAKIQEIPDPEYIQAKRLLDNLDEAVKVLGEPDAGNYFNQTYTAKGQTVGQLIQYMTRSNLRFAPAVRGDEAAYLVLQRALAEYDLAIQSQAVAKK
jgi:hypothetical protein